jgi:hypothetical protein
MSADLRSTEPLGAVRGPDYSVTVLAALAGPDGATDLERPAAAIVEVFDALASGTTLPSTHVVPLRMTQQGGAGGRSGRAVEILDATSLEDVATALGEQSSRIVHAVGWEAGVVASALRQGSISTGGTPRAQIVLEPLDAPTAAEWDLAGHAAALVVQTEAHRRASLQQGVPHGMLHVVAPAAPRCPGHARVELLPSGCRLAVVGDGVDGATMEVIERLLRSSPSVEVVFAGRAGHLSRTRQVTAVVRSWPAQLTARVHAAATLTWSLLAQVDAVLDVSSPQQTPRAALAAMSAGRAVLALPRSGAVGVVLHGQTGLRLHSCDPATVAEGIRHVIGDSRLLHRMGRAGYARWESEHSPTVKALRLADIYDQVAASAS